MGKVEKFMLDKKSVMYGDMSMQAIETIEPQPKIFMLAITFLFVATLNFLWYLDAVLILAGLWCMVRSFNSGRARVKE